MCIDERIVLARLAYGRAIAGARSRPTPASWRRLLAAARNLNDARRERERARAAVEASRAAAVRTRAEAARPQAPPPLAPGEVAAVGASGPPPAREAGAAAARPRWPELEAELARARALVAWSRRLVQEARLLTASFVLPERPARRAPLLPFPA